MLLRLAFVVASTHTAALKPPAVPHPSLPPQAAHKSGHVKGSTDISLTLKDPQGFSALVNIINIISNKQGSGPKCGCTTNWWAAALHPGTVRACEEGSAGLCERWSVASKLCWLQLQTNCTATDQCS